MIERTEISRGLLPNLPRSLNQPRQVIAEPSMDESTLSQDCGSPANHIRGSFPLTWQVPRRRAVYAGITFGCGQVVSRAQKGANEIAVTRRRSNLESGTQHDDPCWSSPTAAGPWRWHHPPSLWRVAARPISALPQNTIFRVHDASAQKKHLSAVEWVTLWRRGGGAAVTLETAGRDYASPDARLDRTAFWIL